MRYNFFLIFTAGCLLFIFLLEHTSKAAWIFFLITMLSFFLHLSLFTDVDVDTLVHVSGKTHNKIVIVKGYPRKQNRSEFIVFFWFFLFLDHFSKLESLINRDISFLLIIIFTLVSFPSNSLNLALMHNLQEFFRIIFELCHKLIMKFHFWPYFDSNTDYFNFQFIRADNCFVKEVWPDVSPRRENFVITEEIQKYASF